MGTPASDNPPEGLVTNGSDTYCFNNLDTAALEQNHGKPRIVGRVRDLPGNSSVACTYQPAVAVQWLLT